MVLIDRSKRLFEIFGEVTHSTQYLRIVLILLSVLSLGYDSFQLLTADFQTVKISSPELRAFQKSLLDRQGFVELLDILE
jgi:hypothetical protein